MNKFLFFIFLLFNSSCKETVDYKTIKKKVNVKSESELVEMIEFRDYSKAGNIDSLKISQLCKKLEDLKEVQDFKKKNSEFFGFLFYGESSSAPDCYWIKVGSEMETHFSTWYNFYIDKKNGDIKILDVFSDSLLTISDWRKSKNYKEI